MRLIDAERLDRELNSFKYETYNLEIRRVEHELKALTFTLIKEQPTAFDLESVKQKIVELQLSVKDKELSATDEEFATMLRGRLRGIADCLEIIESAANATNGKNGE